MSFFPRSLTGRLIWTNIALVALVCLVVGVVTTVALRHYLFQRLDDQLNAADQRTTREFPDDEPPPDLCQPGPGGPGGGVQQGAGALVGHLDDACPSAGVFTDAGGFQPLGDAALETLGDVPADASPHTVKLAGVGTYRVVVRRGDELTLVTGLPTADVEATVGRLIGWEALVALVAVTAAALLGGTLVRRQLRPLHDVATTAREVARLPLATGQVEVAPRVRPDLVDGDTEVGQVGEALNHMLDHVEGALDARHRSEQQMRRFLADASHELRTPLSTISGYAELSRRAPDDVAQVRHAMRRVEAEAARMAGLVDDLLLLARLDAGRALEEHEVDLSRLIVEAVDDARVVGNGHRWALSLPPQPIHVTGDGRRLHQVIANLLANARRHTPAGTTVTVSATTFRDGAEPGGALGGGREGDRPDRVEVRVHDDGPGLPESLRGKEFERFSRGDSSRTRETGGSGLGLSIVRAIVSAHRGSVTVTSAPGSTSFAVVLPMTPQRPHRMST